jgi:hypothetical protein
LVYHLQFFLKKGRRSKMNDNILFIGNGIGHNVKKIIGCPTIEIRTRLDLEKIKKNDIPDCVVIDGEIMDLCVELVMEYIAGIRPGIKRVILSDNLTIIEMGVKRHITVLSRRNLEELESYFQRSGQRL